MCSSDLGAAAKLTPPDQKGIQLKDPRTWKVAGKPMKRLDTGAKINGKTIYAIDLKLPGMLNAAIRQSPVFGSKLVSFDESKISSMPGVKRAVKVNDYAVAVVADTWWHAKKAIDALPIVWDEKENGNRSTATIREQMLDGINAPTAYAFRKEGDAPAAIAAAAKKVEAVYSTPFLAHRSEEHTSELQSH